MKKIAVLLAVLLLSGCAALSYQSPDGTRVDYVRVFTTTDTITGEIAGAKVEVRGQNVNLDEIRAVTESAVKAAVR